MWDYPKANVRITDQVIQVSDVGGYLHDRGQVEQALKRHNGEVQRLLSATFEETAERFKDTEVYRRIEALRAQHLRATQDVNRAGRDIRVLDEKIREAIACGVDCSRERHKRHALTPSLERAKAWHDETFSVLKKAEQEGLQVLKTGLETTRVSLSAAMAIAKDQALSKALEAALPHLLDYLVAVEVLRSDVATLQQFLKLPTDPAPEAPPSGPPAIIEPERVDDGTATLTDYCPQIPTLQL